MTDESLRTVKRLFKSSALLAIGASVHALRIVLLSLLLGNEEFGAVSGVLLMVALFYDIGSLGFTKLIYNQSQFVPGKVSRQSQRVGQFVAIGFGLIFVSAIVAAAVISSVSPLYFHAVLVTLLFSGANMLLLSAFRASKSPFTHPAAYLIKSAAVIVDVVILGLITVPIGETTLWGEALAFPLLLIYGFRIGVLKFRKSSIRQLWTRFRVNTKLGAYAVLSGLSGMMMLNNERAYGALFMNLEQLGVVTKLLMPKVIAAQGAFLIGVHFHRFLVALDHPGRVEFLAKMRRSEILLAFVGLIAVGVGGYLVVQVNRFVYGLEIGIAEGVAITILATIFFFNPYAIFLQASDRFRQLAYANCAALACFFLASILLRPSAEELLILSAATAFASLFLVRIEAQRQAKIPPVDS